LEARKVIHGYTQAVIFTHHVAMGGAVDCQPFKHVTNKDVIIDDIFIDNKFEFLANNVTLRLNEESQVGYHKHHLKKSQGFHCGAIRSR